ncbi:lytic murein transglycosylase [Fulvimarina sp. 2208YS6-2-32]|uniref:Lytic murein transglycosylase n=1 Tax=Fulvimarina uroteuthidis TaxID=3098149 RepID=A0ABU5I2P7_9HYPH|nr:lytic murein transglycosylase [Fulvimarina sp. 2208YS6-2-32]MDY8108441.1 lytic murein transglycosylase [Fulvimarina sp. 2208YS6-2-32]
MKYFDALSARAKTLGAALAIGVGTAMLPATALADAGFQRWIQSFENTAAENGVRRDVYRAAFAGVTEPDPDVLEKARYQPEFNAKVWDYVDNRVNELSVQQGQAYRSQLSGWLDRIEGRFGVDRDILLAIWSMETNYGEILKRDDVMKSLPRSLATLGYLDQRRAKFARQQLIAALKIVQDGHVAARDLTSSWAGAMGHTQFIPTSYRAYAADMDGDGHANIWSSVPDALATAANLLRKNGWQSGKTWGYEVRVPAQYRGGKLERDNRTISQWAGLGFTRADGRPLPNIGDRANLVRLAGDAGPAFLMMKNFFVLKNYNNADKYALAVGMLGDRIGGYGGLVNDWPRGYTPLSMDERFELQKRLASRGLYDGKIDGKIGSGSKGAIVAIQGRAGLPQDGNPSKAVLNYLRQN